MIYVGAKTGRDGIHGATMASAEFNEDTEEKRPTVQVGDPFTEKLLLEACLELMATDAIVAIQDMGAAGLTSSSVEMAAKGGLGIELDLDQVPMRETGMTAYEIMLSESQERMLMVLKPEARGPGAQAIFEKWELDFAEIGRLTDTGRLVLTMGGEVVGRPAGRAAGRARRRSTTGPSSRRRAAPRIDRRRRRRRSSPLAGAGEADRLPRPRQQALDLGAVRSPGHGPHRAAARAAMPPWCASARPARASRITTDCTPRYCQADPETRRRARRWPRAGATSPPSAPGRSPSPTT